MCEALQVYCRSSGDDHQSFHFDDCCVLSLSEQLEKPNVKCACHSKLSGPLYCARMTALRTRCVSCVYVSLSKCIILYGISCSAKVRSLFAKQLVIDDAQLALQSQINGEITAETVNELVAKMDLMELS